MSDLISKLKEYAIHLSKSEHFEAALFASEIEKRIRDYGWHDVSEYPTGDGIYLVTVNLGVSIVDVIRCDFDAKHKRWYCDYGEQVIAWMPLPEPYKPEAAQC